MMVLGPRQPDLASCGLFVIINAKSLCMGVIPDDSRVYSSIEIQNVRQKITLQLSCEDQLFPEILYSPEPPLMAEDGKQMSIEPGTMVFPTSALLPDPELAPDASTAVDNPNLMALMLLNEWELYLNLNDNKYWPGQVVKVDIQRKECLVIIPRKIIPNGEKGHSLVKTGASIIYDLVHVPSAPPERLLKEASVATQVVNEQSSTPITSNEVETNQAPKIVVAKAPAATGNAIEVALTFEIVSPPQNSLSIQLESSKSLPSTNMQGTSFKILVPRGKVKQKATMDLEPVKSSLHPVSYTKLNKVVVQYLQ
ncbi:hypothetical protein Clacol_003135 [Clathrus columnatus]|uniref:Uncharacterized protein n=1 Tax=Clathrus columnatus TaxID=1419009 RepID=A0AAV5A7G2_9AGAM|nr:hypothetical protein Clacol_003135 [Clathrus columnatus]